MKIHSKIINKKFNMIKKAIDVPLMDTTNIANLIMDTVVSKNKHFFFNFYSETDVDFLKMYNGIPHYIYGIVLAKNKEDAFELLKSKLKTIVIGKNSHYNLDTKEIIRKEKTLEELTIEDFDKSGALYNSEYIVYCEPRIDYLLILQGYYDGSSFDSGLTYTLCEYKYKCKPQKEYVNMYEDRHDYYDCHSYYPDKRLDTEYSIEEAQSCIQYLF